MWQQALLPFEPVADSTISARALLEAYSNTHKAVKASLTNGLVVGREGDYAETNEVDYAKQQEVEVKAKAVYGMQQDRRNIWANVIIQVLLHVPTFSDYVGAHACSESNMCPAGILRNISSELKQNGKKWGNEHSNKVFDNQDGKENAQDASEALTRLFSLVKRCEQNGNTTAEVPIDRLVGIKLQTTCTDGEGHVSVTPVIFNHEMFTNVTTASCVTVCELLKQSMAPVDIPDYDCTQCVAKVAATQTTMYLPPLPPVLLVTLTRTEDSNGVQFVQPVYLPGSKLQYKLRAVICYNNKNNKYWLVVKKMGAGGISSWIKAEDNKVTSISEKTLASSKYGKVAQIIIYEQETEEAAAKAEKEAAAEAKANEEVATTTYTSISSSSSSSSMQRTHNGTTGRIGTTTITTTTSLPMIFPPTHTQENAVQINRAAEKDLDEVATTALNYA